MIQFTVLLHTDKFIFVWFYKKRKRVPKPLLGRQNRVTLTGGRHNLVPGLTTERRRNRPYVHTTHIAIKHNYLCTIVLGVR